MSQLEPRFSPLTEEELRRAGWLPGRRVESSLMEQWCYLKLEPISKSEPPLGFLSISPKVFRFLEEFGGLEVCQEGQGGQGEKYQREPFRFDPQEGLELYNDPGYWFFLETAFDDLLYPIGWGGHEKEHEIKMVLVMGASGRFYGFDNGGFSLFGESAEEGIETLVHGREGRELDLYVPPDRDRRALIIKAARAKAQT